MDTKTVATLLISVARKLLEGTSFTSGLWDNTDLINAINWAEPDFIEKTGILKARTPVSAVIGQRLYNEPATSMGIDRVTYQQVPLSRVTEDDLNREGHDWRTRPNKTPGKWHQDNLPTKKFEVDRGPVETGTFHVIHTLAPTPVVDTNSPLNVPSAFYHYLKYGVLEHLLRMPGEQQDLKKAEYCHMRYERGIALAKALMGKIGETRG